MVTAGKQPARRPNKPRPIPSTVPLDALAAAESEQKLEALGMEMEALVEQNAELRSQIVAMESVVNARYIAGGESDSIIRRTREQRDDVTRKLAQSVDALRSTSITRHSTKHKGSYGMCSDERCCMARDMWGFIGEGPGMEVAINNPEAWWDRTGQDLSEPEIIDYSGPKTFETPEEQAIPLDADEELPEPVAIETVPTDLVADEDLGLDPKYIGKRLRVARVPDPLAERDPSDPGLPKARV
jgi:hypothetical protein